MDRTIGTESEGLMDVLLDAASAELEGPDGVALCVVTAMLAQDRETAKLMADALAAECTPAQAATREFLEAVSLLASSSVSLSLVDLRALLSTASAGESGGAHAARRHREQ